MTLTNEIRWAELTLTEVNVIPHITFKGRKAGLQQKFVKTDGTFEWQFIPTVTINQR